MTRCACACSVAVKAFLFSGAGLSQPVWDQLDRLGERTVGERIRMFTGLGMTETAPSCTFAVGADTSARATSACPAPGVEVKLVPMDDKTGSALPRPQRDARLLARARADRRGVRRRGLLPHRRRGEADRHRRSERGLLFDGRIAEDFKLSTGTFVSVGPLRARIIAAGASVRAGRGDRRPQPRPTSAC